MNTYKTLALGFLVITSMVRLRPAGSYPVFIPMSTTTSNAQYVQRKQLETIVKHFRVDQAGKFVALIEVMDEDDKELLMQLAGIAALERPSDDDQRHLKSLATVIVKTYNTKRNDRLWRICATSLNGSLVLGLVGVCAKGIHTLSPSSHGASDPLKVTAQTSGSLGILALFVSAFSALACSWPPDIPLTLR